jgi:hypothetical protein
MCGIFDHASGGIHGLHFFPATRDTRAVGQNLRIVMKPTILVLSVFMLLPSGMPLEAAGVSPDVQEAGRLASLQSTVAHTDCQTCSWESPTLGLPAPGNALRLFDGTSTGHFETGSRMTADGHLAAGATTTKTFQDFHLHVEFKVPYKPEAVGQDRGNSGVYIQRRYEVQILDSCGLTPQIDGCGALYRQRKPDINACTPPLMWQTYDIAFTAARFNEDGVKTTNARITVWHNGVLIHNDVELTNKTGAGQPEGPNAMPITFQDHDNPVVFRNIWIIDQSEVSGSDSIAQWNPVR